MPKKKENVLFNTFCMLIWWNEIQEMRVRVEVKVKVDVRTDRQLTSRQTFRSPIRTFILLVISLLLKKLNLDPSIMANFTLGMSSVNRIFESRLIHPRPGFRFQKPNTKQDSHIATQILTTCNNSRTEF